MFVVIQYTITPAGKLMMKNTKNSGMNIISRRWVWSIVGLDIISVEPSCVPTYSTISTTSVAARSPCS